MKIVEMLAAPVDEIDNIAARSGTVRIRCSSLLNHGSERAQLSSWNKLGRSELLAKKEQEEKAKYDLIDAEYYIVDGKLDFEEIDAQYHISDGLKDLEWSCYLTSTDDPEARIYPDGGCLIRELRNDSEEFEDPDETVEVVSGFFSRLAVTGRENEQKCYILNVEAADGLYLFGDPTSLSCNNTQGSS